MDEGYAPIGDEPKSKVPPAVADALYYMAKRSARAAVVLADLQWRRPKEGPKRRAYELLIDRAEAVQRGFGSLRVRLEELGEADLDVAMRLARLDEESSALPHLEAFVKELYPKVPTELTCAVCGVDHLPACKEPATEPPLSSGN